MPSTRDIRLPADSIIALRRALVRQLGAEAANRGLQEAGHAAGDTVFDRLGGDGAVADTPRDTFWDRLAGLFRELGWGVIEHSSPHPGVGALTARDWFEADPRSRVPVCPFTTGVLANILGKAGGGDVAVLSVPCEDGGAGCVRFLFGAPTVLDQLYAELRDGAAVEATLGSLG